MAQNASNVPIDQSTFDQVVQENIEDLDMEPEEAVTDAIEQLTSQKANLIFIIAENPISDESNPAFGQHKCLYLTNQLKKFITNSTENGLINFSKYSTLLNPESLEIISKLSLELATDNLPKRYYSCKTGKLHMQLELIFFNLAKEFEKLKSNAETKKYNANEFQIDPFLINFTNSILTLAINTFQFQPDCVTRQITTDTCKITSALIEQTKTCPQNSSQKTNNEIILKLLKLVSSMSKKHEENRNYLYHSGFFENVGDLLRKDNLHLEENNKILSQLCSTVRNFLVDDDPRQTTCRAHDNARDLVNDQQALENLCRQLKNVTDDNNNNNDTNTTIATSAKYKLKKEVILTLSKLLVRNEFCLQSSEDSCGLLKLIVDNLSICLEIDESAIAGGDGHKRQPTRTANQDPDHEINKTKETEPEPAQETILLRPLLLLLKTMCGNDEVKYRVTQTEDLIQNIVFNINKWLVVSGIVDAGMTCLHVLALRQPLTCELLSKLGAASLCIRAMQLHSTDRQVILNCCGLIRNMVARTRHLKKEFIEGDVEELLNKVVLDFGKDINILQAAKAAMRDLDLDAGLKEQWTGTPGLSHEIRRDD